MLKIVTAERKSITYVIKLLNDFPNLTLHLILHSQNFNAKLVISCDNQVTSLKHCVSHKNAHLLNIIKKMFKIIKAQRKSMM